MGEVKRLTPGTLFQWSYECEKKGQVDKPVSSIYNAFFSWLYGVIGLSEEAVTQASEQVYNAVCTKIRNELPDCDIEKLAFNVFAYFVKNCRNSGHFWTDFIDICEAGGIYIPDILCGFNYAYLQTVWFDITEVCQWIRRTMYNMVWVYYYTSAITDFVRGSEEYKRLVNLVQERAYYIAGDKRQYELNLEGDPILWRELEKIYLFSKLMNREQYCNLLSRVVADTDKAIEWLKECRKEENVIGVTDILKKVIHRICGLYLG